MDNKNIIIIIVIGVLTGFSIAQASERNAIEAEFTPNGFRELKWGDSYVDNKNVFTFFQKGDGIELYTRPNERLSIGKAKLKDLVYTFHNDRFSGVVFHTEGIVNKTAIIETLDAIFSKKKRKPIGDDQVISWINRNVNVVIRCGLSDICQIFYAKK